MSMSHFEFLRWMGGVKGGHCELRGNVWNRLNSLAGEESGRNPDAYMVTTGETVRALVRKAWPRLTRSEEIAP